MCAEFRPQLSPQHSLLSTVHLITFCARMGTIGGFARPKRKRLTYVPLALRIPS
jgi:hypothetical protein